MEISITHIWYFTVMSTLVAEASLNKQKLVGTSSAHMANGQYQGQCGLATSLLLWTSTRKVV